MFSNERGTPVHAVDLVDLALGVHVPQDFEAITLYPSVLLQQSAVQVAQALSLHDAASQRETAPGRASGTSLRNGPNHIAALTHLRHARSLIFSFNTST